MPVPGPFPTNQGLWGGGIYPVLSGASVVTGYSVDGSEVAGAVTLDLMRHFYYDTFLLNLIDVSLTIIYTIDGAPVSPRLTSPYTWVWDSTTVADGGHVAGVILVDGTGDTTHYVPLACTFVVDNVPGPVIGPQLIPSLGGGVIRSMQRTGVPEWISWTTGYTRPHPVSTVPYNAQVSPPAHSRGLPDAGLSQSFIEEPLTRANVGIDSTDVQIVRTKTGHIVVEVYFMEKGSTADGSLAGVLAEPLIDGPRDDNGVSPYSTFVPHPTLRGFTGIDLGGRLFTLGLNGTVTTIVGRRVKRDIVPYSPNDPRVTEADRRALQIDIVGTFPDGEWNQPNDLCYDPRDNNIIYVADTNNGRITKTDLSVSPPHTIAYATGFVGPSSVVCAADGTLYVTDYDAGTVSSIAHDSGPIATIASGLDQPFTVRFDSHGNLIINELRTGTLKRIDIVTHAVTLIVANLCGPNWNWIAVDTKGNVGPVDDILAICALGGDNSTINRVSADGSRVAPASLGGGHYPWVVAIDKDEGRVLTYGFGDSAPKGWRLTIPTDWQVGDYYGYLNRELSPFNDRLGGMLDIYGTVPEFPAGARPAQTALRGSGYSTFPGFASYDDLAQLSIPEIGAYIQAGLGGGTPRPEFTGRDLQLAVDHIQKSSALYPYPLFPHLPAPPADTTPPIISNVTATLTGGTTAQVTWDTDEPALGYVRFGSSADQAKYFRWSDIETAFVTSHSVLLHYLPDNTVVHFAIVVEDLASNFTMTTDHAIATGSPPSPPPPPPPPPPPSPPPPPPPRSLSMVFVT